MTEHLDSLAVGQPIEVPVYDYAEHNRSSETVRVEPADVIVPEGGYNHVALEMLAGGLAANLASLARRQ